MIKCPLCGEKNDPPGHLCTDDFIHYDIKGHHLIGFDCDRCSFSGYWKVDTAVNVSSMAQLQYWHGLCATSVFDMSWEELTGREWTFKNYYLIE